ncbi:hypothetical protein ACSQ67_017661 [Phaseolus vulgaris]
MEKKSSVGCLFYLIYGFFIFGSSKAEMVPAVYVFGDSLVDVGNNNYLTLSIAKANHRHYGIDFPTHKPTGRFSNGKNAADFRQSIPLTKQVDYYSIVHEEMTREKGADGLQKHLSKSVFVVVIGSNDLFAYFESSDLRKKSTPHQYVDSMAFSLKLQLQRLYDHGARKFEIAGVGTLGCCPEFRLKNKTECVVEVNYWSVKYNEALQSMLKEWQSENGGIIYSYFDTYAAINDLIQSPASYGFSEVKGACCGLGELNARAPCLPLSNLCPNRQDHIFFDQFHPTEAASRIFVNRLFDGSSAYASPINMRQLVAA